MTGLLSAIKKILALPLALPLAAIGMAAGNALDKSMTEINLHAAESNHARFEGTWTPHEARLATARRELDLLDEAEENHAQAEGAPVRPLASQ